MATIIELLEAHQVGYLYADISGLRKQGCTGCDFFIEGQFHQVGDTKEIHRRHLAEVLEQHMREREERAWSAGFHKGRKTPDGSHISTWPTNPHRKESSDGR